MRYGGGPNWAMLLHLWQQKDLDCPIKAAGRRARGEDHAPFSMIPSDHPAVAFRGLVDRDIHFPSG